jgi:hypothetical protein
MNWYQEAKSQLKNHATAAKIINPNDKPFIRQYINDGADSIVKEIILNPKWDISETKRNQYTNWLHLYAAKLHP